MKKHKTKKIIQAGALSIVSLGVASGSATAFTVTPSNSGDQLVNSILGKGIDVVSGSVKYNGATGASGGFQGAESVIGIDTGVIMTSGQASYAPGPNNADNKTGNNGFPGDEDLNKLLPAGSSGTRDATTLEFEFTSDGGDLFFNYVFASEEYNEYVNSQYNDVFGFFLDGQNIALIPGTTTPVAINTVNGGNPFGTNATNPQDYNNNDPNDPKATFDIQYDGFTKVFQAKALDLEPGKHKIKLAIADTGDAALDSGVFIQGGSFSDTPIDPIDPNPIPEPTTVAGLLVFGALGGKQLMNKHKKAKK